MLEIEHFSRPPIHLEKDIRKMFSEYSFKDFQQYSLGISKDEIADYLWNSLVKLKGVLQIAFRNNKIVGLIWITPNKFIMKQTGIESWSIRHFLFDESVDEESKQTLLQKSITNIELKNAQFVELKLAADDISSIDIAQKTNFKYIAGTVTCLVPNIKEQPEPVDGIYVSEAEDKDKNEIYSLVMSNHSHNHFHYDPVFPTEKVTDLYGNLICKTIEMKFAHTVVAKNKDGVIEGVITYKTNPAISKYAKKNFASLDFIAVRSDCRTKGLGHYLNLYALHEIYKLDIDKTVVRTLFNNYQALAALRKINMKIIASDTIFHRWLL